MLLSSSPNDTPSTFVNATVLAQTARGRFGGGDVFTAFINTSILARCTLESFTANVSEKETVPAKEAFAFFYGVAVLYSQ